MRLAKDWLTHIKTSAHRNPRRIPPRPTVAQRRVSDFWGVGYVGSRVTAEHPYPPTVHSTSPTASRPIPSYPPTPTRSLETLHNIPQTKESSMKEGRGRTSHDTHIRQSTVAYELTNQLLRGDLLGGWQPFQPIIARENLPFVQKGSRETTRSLDRPVRRRRRGGRGQGRARRGHGRGRLGRGAPYPPTLRGPPPRPLDPYPPPLLPLLPPYHTPQKSETQQAPQHTRRPTSHHSNRIWRHRMRELVVLLPSALVGHHVQIDRHSRDVAALQHTTLAVVEACRAYQQMI